MSGGGAAGARVFESALFRTTCTCLLTERQLLVVDPNWLPAEVAAVRAYADRVGAGRERFLLFTHSDYDHIIGYGAFADFTTLASQRFVDNPARAEQLRKAREWDDEYYIRRDYPLDYPRIDRPVAGDEEEVTLGGETYRCYQAPGHNYDGLLTLHPASGTLLTGDYLCNVEFPFVYHSVADYRTTLDKLDRLIRGGAVRTLIAGHGDPTSDRGEMERRLADARAYLDALEAAVRSNRELDTAALFARYGFPLGHAKFHAANVKLMRQYVHGGEKN